MRGCDCVCVCVCVREGKEKKSGCKSVGGRVEVAANYALSAYMVHWWYSITFMEDLSRCMCLELSSRIPYSRKYWLSLNLVVWS